MDERLFRAELARTIRRERERCGFTPGQVAHGLGLPAATYRNYELGRRHIGAHVLARLAPLLGASADQLLEEASSSVGERNKGVHAVGVDRERLAALTKEESLRSRYQGDLGRLATILERALRLVTMLQARELTGSMALLGESVTCDFSHTLRFLLVSDQQILPRHRTAAIESLLRIYEVSHAATFGNRAAREQAAYLSAASGLPEARQAMLNAWETEQDSWVRRSIVRGLAKTGLPRRIADAHEQELATSGEMQRIDLGYWRFYAGDEGNLAVALSAPLPDKGYRNTINALLGNLLSGMPRDDRRFDFLTLAFLLDHVTTRTISKGQRSLIRCVLAAEPREPEARRAWQHLRDTAGEYMEIPTTFRRR